MKRAAYTLLALGSLAVFAGQKRPDEPTVPPDVAARQIRLVDEMGRTGAELKIADVGGHSGPSFALKDEHGRPLALPASLAASAAMPQVEAPTDS